MEYSYAKGYCLHMAKRVCHTPHGTINLTDDDMFILWFVSARRNQLVTFEQLRSAINLPEASDGHIKTMVDALNQRLRPTNAYKHKSLIMTVPRLGFILFDANPPTH